VENNGNGFNKNKADRLLAQTHPRLTPCDRPQKKAEGTIIPTAF